MALLTSIAVGAAVANAASIGLGKRQDTPEPPTFDWDSIEPSTELNWVDCFTPPFQCARLAVPLNYSNPEDGTGAIAMVKYPSPLADTSSYRGPILYNPGGPGGSTVDALVGGGDQVPNVFGEEFDIIGFDPRGTGATTPGALTFPGMPEEAVEQMNEKFPALTDISEASWPTLPERIEELRGFAEVNERERGEVLRHATTDNVARDMLAIVEAHGREKLQFYGISYGSALGSIFVSMFPDKVERMVMDGVLDLDGYYSNDWTINIEDADKTLEWFFDFCAEAGPDLCAFHANTSEAVRQRYHALETLLQNDTIAMPDSSDGEPFKLSHFQSIVHFALYNPTSFPGLSAIMVTLERGDATMALEAMGGADLAPYNTFALRCTDTEQVEDTAEELEEYSRRMQNASRYLAGGAAGVRASCNGWKVNPAGYKDTIGANISIPILFVANTADPGTPHRGAELTSEKFPGSRILTYDAPGHGMLAVPNNPCVYAHLRSYMLNGTLPEEGSVCENEVDFFASGNETSPGAGTDGGDSAENDDDSENSV